jgi:hypothetical protein
LTPYKIPQATAWEVRGHMDYDTYGAGAVELAIDLANAQLEGADGVRDFVHGHAEWIPPGVPLELSDRDAATLVRVSTAVRGVALADAQAEVVERLNALLARAHPRPYATDHDGELHLHYAKPDAPLLEQLTTTVAMGISQVVVQHGWQRLGVCSAEGCDDVYVDTSRNASRRYCSNTCASRSTVAAYRARRKA